MANFTEIRSIVSKLKMLFLPQLVYQIEMNKEDIENIDDRLNIFLNDILIL